ncbi:MAG: TRAP transporter fused permease subunit [Alphaproteobacteria bacterium]|nr:TRAP transporter fused permease subunit [Alphaproteobacteria bacterium]
MRLGLSIKITRDACAGLLTLFSVFVAGFGIFDTTIVYATMVTLGGLIGYLTLAEPRDVGSNKIISFDNLHIILAVIFIALIWRWATIMLEQESYFIFIERPDFIFGWLGIAMLGYLTYRFFGIPMLLVFAATIFYALLPDEYGGGDLNWESLADRQWFTTDGVFGRPLQVVSTTILIFIVFGGVLQTSGAGGVLLKMAFAATGRISGGPAHASIVGSAIFGMMSGAAIANVVSTGVFTIPIIKRAGFKAKFAAAVEATASTGGQIMPPVMGVVAFIMADVTGISYLSIVVAAIIPAIFYYLSLFLVVLVECRKEGIGPTPIEKREIITRKDWLQSLAFWLPLGTIIGVLLAGRTAQNAGFYALIVAIVTCLALFPKFRSPTKWLEAIIVSGKTAATLLIIVTTVGVVIGIVNMTGIGLVFADIIRTLSGDNLFLALIMVMLGCLIMGMGVPSVTAYLILALVMGPVLENLGIAKISAHMFMLYFGVLSVITPPVALAAFAAAPIAGSKPMETGFEAIRLAFAGFIIPFMFIYYPDILIIDGYTIYGLVWASVCFLLATWMIGTGVARFEHMKLPIWESVLRVSLAIAILIPEIWSTIIGGLLAIILVYLHAQQNKQQLKKTKGGEKNESVK